MEIPSHISILYKNYEIIQQENLHDGGDDLYGQIHYLPEKSILNAESTEEQKKATLVHELVHAMDDMYGIGLKEKQIEKLGSAIYMMVRDNFCGYRGLMPSHKDTRHGKISRSFSGHRRHRGTRKSVFYPHSPKNLIIS